MDGRNEEPLNLEGKLIGSHQKKVSWKEQLFERKDLSKVKNMNKRLERKQINRKQDVPEGCLVRIKRVSTTCTSEILPCVKDKGGVGFS